MNGTGINLSPASKVCFGAIFATMGFYLVYQWLLPKPLPGIPYNSEATKSLFGDALAMDREVKATGEFSVWLAKQVEKMHSPVCQVFIHPFSKPWILVGDFHEAQDILMRRPEFDKSRFLIDGLQGLGAWHSRSVTNSTFKANRRLKQDLMTPSFLNNIMGHAMHANALKVISLFELKMKLSNGRPFNILRDYNHAALDVMIQFAFGNNLSDSALDPQLDLVSKLKSSQIPYGEIDDPVNFPEGDIGAFLKATEDATRVLEMTTLSPIPKLIFWWWSRQDWLQKIFFQKDLVVPQQVIKAIANCNAGKVKSALEHIVMREKAAADREGRNPRFESQMMIDEAYGDVITGHHTTGGTMSWVTKYLTGYPNTQSRLRSALYSAIPNAVEEKRLPTFEELNHARIPYLEAVIEETLRLTPFSIVRETMEDTQILGYRIPKGCQVFMVNGGPGFLSPSLVVDEAARSPTSKGAKARRKWDETKDLKIFEPERWLVGRDDGGVDFDPAAGPQLGFGMGVRQCWGRRLAHLEIRTVLALVTWNFEFLEIPEQLGGYTGYDGISRQPHRAFVRLKKLAR
ncbi:cytochrome P450 [Hypoxylon sp. FL1857]|nr:cytochrome P450 [Hypoxylon sp. FL1857]